MVKVMQTQTGGVQSKTGGKGKVSGYTLLNGVYVPFHLGQPRDLQTHEGQRERKCVTPECKVCGGILHTEMICTKCGTDHYLSLDECGFTHYPVSNGHTRDSNYFPLVP